MTTEPVTFDRLRQIADRLPEPEAAWLRGVLDDVQDGTPLAVALGEDAMSRRERRDRYLAAAVALLDVRNVSQAVSAVQAVARKLDRMRAPRTDFERLVSAANAAYPLPSRRRLHDLCSQQFAIAKDRRFTSR